MHSLQPTASTAPRNVNFGNIESTYAIINWLLPESPNGDVEMYTVLLTDSRNNEEKRFSSDEESVNATGLVPFVTYSVVVYAQTDEVGERSSVLSFMTLQDSKQTLTPTYVHM